MEFNGVRQDAAAQALPEGLFQTDQGSDRFQTGSWRRRRGMRRVNTAKLTNAITGLLGFDLPGTDFAVLVIEGANAQGLKNIGEL